MGNCLPMSTSNRSASVLAHDENPGALQLAVVCKADWTGMLAVCTGVFEMPCVDSAGPEVLRSLHVEQSCKG